MPDVWRFSEKRIQLLQNNYGERVLLMFGGEKRLPQVEQAYLVSCAETLSACE